MLANSRTIRWLLAPALLLAGGVLRAQDAEPKPEPVPPTRADSYTVTRPVRQAAAPSTVYRPVQQPQFLYRNVMLSQWDQELGVSVAQVDETLRAQLELPKEQGLIVTTVRGGSPAAKAGVRRHDILLTAAERPLKGVEDLVQSHHHDTGADQPLKIKMVRGGKERTVEVAPPTSWDRRTFIRRAPNPTPWVYTGDGYVIGVNVEPVDAALREHLDIPPGKGLIVLSTEPKGPAEKAGIRPHDVLLTFGDKELAAEEPALRAAIQESQGKATPVKLLRGGKALTVEVTPSRREIPTEARWNVQVQRPEEYWVGLPTGAVDAALREQLGLAQGKGLLVGDVPPEGPAAKAGFKKHDILLKAGDTELAGEEQLRAAVQEAREKPITFTLLRAGKEMTLAVTPEKRPAMYSVVTHFTPENLQLIGPGVMTGPMNLGFVDPNAANPPGIQRILTGPPATPDATQKKLDDLSAQVERLSKLVEELSATIKAENNSKK